MYNYNDFRIVYPTFLDPFTQSIYPHKFNSEVIVAELKMNSLLFDFLCPSISHILCSSKTFSAIYKEPALLEEGIIRPLLPKGIHSAEDYIEWLAIDKDINIHNKLLPIKISKNSYLTIFLNRDKIHNIKNIEINTNIRYILKMRLRFLDKYCKKFYYYNQPNVAEIVSNAILYLLDPRRGVYSFKEKDKVEKLQKIAMNQLDKRGVLNRGLLFLLIDAYNFHDKDRKLLKKIINSIYYSGGALVAKPALEVEKFYISTLAKQCEYIKNIAEECLLLKKAFSSLLKCISVGLENIVMIDVDVIKRIRRSIKGEVRNTLLKIIDRWQKGKIFGEDIHSEFPQRIEGINEQINQLIINEYTNQKATYMKFDALRNRIKNISFQITLAGTLLNLTDFEYGKYMTLSSPLVNVIGTPIFEYILRKRANFIVFSNMLKAV